jgi:hypothetical protein
MVELLRVDPTELDVEPESEDVYLCREHCSGCVRD